MANSTGLVAFLDNLPNGYYGDIKYYIGLQKKFMLKIGTERAKGAKHIMASYDKTVKTKN